PARGGRNRPRAGLLRATRRARPPPTLRAGMRRPRRPGDQARPACRAPSRHDARPAREWASRPASPPLYVPSRFVTDEAQQQPAGPRSMGSRLFELSRHTAIYGIGGLVSRFLAVLMLPLYTSYVSVGDYGRIELLMSLMAVAVVVIRGGANFGFIRFYFLDKEREYRRRLIRTVFWAQMTYATLALALCVIFASEIAR